MVESSSDEILAGADTIDVAFLVIGDPFGYGSVSTHLGQYRNVNLPSEPLPIPTLSYELESSAFPLKACTMPPSCLQLELPGSNYTTSVRRSAWSFSLKSGDPRHSMIAL